jgi:hypothetical protein
LIHGYPTTHNLFSPQTYYIFTTQHFLTNIIFLLPSTTSTPHHPPDFLLENLTTQTCYSTSTSPLILTTFLPVNPTMIPHKSSFLHHRGSLAAHRHFQPRPSGLTTHPLHYQHTHTKPYLAKFHTTCFICRTLIIRTCSQPTSNLPCPPIQHHFSHRLPLGTIAPLLHAIFITFHQKPFTYTPPSLLTTSAFLANFPPPPPNISIIKSPCTLCNYHQFFWYVPHFHLSIRLSLVIYHCLLLHLTNHSLLLADLTISKPSHMARLKSTAHLVSRSNSQLTSSAKSPSQGNSTASGSNKKRLIGNMDALALNATPSVVGKSIPTNPGYFSSGRFLNGEGVKRLLFSQLGSLVKVKRF